MRTEEIKEQIHEVKRKIKTMEWDEARNQLNEGSKTYMEKLKKKLTELEEELKKAEGETVEEKKEEEEEEHKVNIRKEEPVHEEEEQEQEFKMPGK